MRVCRTSLLTGVRKGSGDWLHTVKVTAGFAELALALFYLAKADQVDFWKGFRFGQDARKRPVQLAMVWSSLLVGAIHRMGKTFAAVIIRNSARKKEKNASGFFAARVESFSVAPLVSRRGPR